MLHKIENSEDGPTEVGKKEDLWHPRGPTGPQNDLCVDVIWVSFGHLEAKVEPLSLVPSIRYSLVCCIALPFLRARGRAFSSSAFSYRPVSALLERPDFGVGEKERKLA